MDQPLLASTGSLWTPASPEIQIPPVSHRRMPETGAARCGRLLAGMGCALLLLFGPAGAALALPFTNGDFETGALSPWYQNGDISDGEDWNVTNADANSGAFSATNTGNNEIRQDFDGILVDDITEISFWAKHPDPDTTALAFNLYYDDNTFDQFQLNTVGSDWNFFDVTTNAVTGMTLVGIGIFGVSTPCGDACDRTYVDDVTIAAVPEPSTASLLGLGVAGFAGIRRRRAR